MWGVGDLVLALSIVGMIKQTSLPARSEGSSPLGTTSNVVGDVARPCVSTFSGEVKRVSGYVTPAGLIAVDHSCGPRLPPTSAETKRILGILRAIEPQPTVYE